MEGTQGVNCSSADRAVKTSSCLCARDKKGPLVLSWGADPWKENRIFTPVHVYVLLSSSSGSVVRGLQEEVITSVRSVDIVGRNS